jgi:hypothetical protein
MEELTFLRTPQESRPNHQGKARETRLFEIFIPSVSAVVPVDHHFA